MGLLNYIPELDPNGQQVNRTAATGYGVVNPGVPATEPVYYGKPKAAEPGKKRKVSPWTLLGAGLLGGVWSQHNPQGFDRAMGAIGQGLQRQQELELKRQQEANDEAWRQREKERWDEDREARKTYQTGLLGTKEGSAADLTFSRLTSAYNTAYRVDPEGANRTYGPALAQAAQAAGLPWPSTLATTPGILGTGAKVAADVDYTTGPKTAKTEADIAYTQGPKTENTQARTATEEMMREPRLNLLGEQVQGLVNKNAVTGNPVYQQGQINAQPLRNVHQEQVNDTFLAQNAAKTALLLAQIEKTLREPAPRGTGGKGGKGAAPADPNGAVAPRIYPNDLLANAGATGLPVSVASAIYSGYAGMFKKDSNGNIVRVKGIWTPKREAEMRAKFKAARQGKPVGKSSTQAASSGPKGGLLGGIQEMIDEIRIVNSLKGPK